MGKYSIAPKVAVITEEDAISQFVPFLEQYGIDLEKHAEKMTGTGKVGKVTEDDIGDSYVEKICAGDLSFEKQSSGDVWVTQHLRDTAGDITMVQYKKLFGRHRKALSGKDNGVEKSYDLCAQLSGLTPAFFEKMGAHDSSVALEVAALFQLA